MIKAFLIAVLFSVCGWYAHAWYVQHGVPATVTVTVTQSDAPVASPKVSRPAKATKLAPKQPTVDAVVDYNRTHPAYTTPGIGYYDPPRI